MRQERRQAQILAVVYEKVRVAVASTGERHNSQPTSRMSCASRRSIAAVSRGCERIAEAPMRQRTSLTPVKHARAAHKPCE